MSPSHQMYLKHTGVITMSQIKTKGRHVPIHQRVKNDSVSLLSSLETRGKALFLIVVLGFGGTFQNGYHNTALSSPSPVRDRAFL